MKFHSRRIVKPEDLNANGTLFGGKVRSWIDEEAISEINFLSSAVLGDIVEIGIEVVSFGTSSITLNSEVRNKMTHETIIIVDNIIIVNLDEDGNPHPHGKKEIEFVKDRLSRSNS